MVAVPSRRGKPVPRGGPSLRQSGRPVKEVHIAVGTIKRLVRDRGFGFIQPDGTAEEVFFHSSSVENPTFDELNEGQHVEF